MYLCTYQLNVCETESEEVLKNEKYMLTFESTNSTRSERALSSRELNNVRESQ
jgi:hypothetical protein